MGFYKEQDIDNQEQGLYLPSDSDEEFFFYHTISGFCEITKKYGYELVVKNLDDDTKFELLCALIKSNGMKKD